MQCIFTYILLHTKLFEYRLKPFKPSEHESLTLCRCDVGPASPFAGRRRLPANTRHLSNVGLLLGHPRTLGQSKTSCIVSIQNKICWWLTCSQILHRGNNVNTKEAKQSEHPCKTVHLVIPLHTSCSSKSRYARQPRNHKQDQTH